MALLKCESGFHISEIFREHRQQSGGIIPSVENIKQITGGVINEKEFFRGDGSGYDRRRAVCAGHVHGADSPVQGAEINTARERMIG